MNLFTGEPQEYKCPSCGSEDVLVGAFLLSCCACGWSYMNKYPCTICGKPSFSSCSMGENGNEVYHGCKEHPAGMFYQQRLQQQEAERK